MSDAGSVAAALALDADDLCEDVARLVRVRSLTGDERAAMERFAERATALGLGLGAELHQHDLGALRSAPGPSSCRPSRPRRTAASARSPSSRAAAG